jgi:hypothetical protein
LRAFLGRTDNLKAIADYETGPGSKVTQEQAADAIAGARRFVAAIEKLIGALVPLFFDITHGGGFPRITRPTQRRARGRRGAIRDICDALCSKKRICAINRGIKQVSRESHLRRTVFEEANLCDQ